MKAKDQTAEAWPEMDEVHQTPLLPPTHQTDNSSIVINMNNSNENSKDSSQTNS